MNAKRSITYWLPVALMFAGVAINVFQFEGIERKTRNNYKAWHSYKTPDIFEIAITHDNSARRWVGPFYYVGKLYPYSDIIIPKRGIKSWFDFDLGMLSFGKASRFIKADYNPVTFLKGVDLDSHELPVGEYAPDIGTTHRVLNERLAFFVGPNPSGSFIVMTPDGRPGRTGRIHFVDTGLIPDELLRTLRLE